MACALTHPYALVRLIINHLKYHLHPSAMVRA